jgi:membrane-bound serine protease (ClpP class)
MLPVTPTLAFVLIALGCVLLLAELFLPTGGVLFALSVVCIILGVSAAFFCDQTMGIVTLLAVFVGLPILAGIGLHYWPRTPLGKRVFLSGPHEDATLATMPVNLELEQLRGHVGRAIGTLRPSGIVDFDGRRVDTITEGMMVEAGTWVRCIDVKAGKVIVRPVPKPELGDLENMDFS